MALVDEFELANTDHFKIHDPVRARYYLHDLEGVPYMQIKIYAKGDHSCLNSAKQQIQIGKAGAEQLVGILRQHFNIA